MKKKTTKKKPATQVTVLGEEHDLSRFAEDGPSPYLGPSRYALDQLKYDASRKCLIGTDGRIFAVVGLDAGPQDMLIDAKALREVMSEATPRRRPRLKRTGDKVSIESQDGRTVRQAGGQHGKWPLSWPACCTVDVSEAIVLSLDPRLLKAIADYAIACDEDCVRFALEPNDYGAVDSGMVWQVGNTVGVLMPLGREETPSKLSKLIRAAIQAPLKALKLGKFARKEKP